MSDTPTATLKEMQTDRLSWAWIVPVLVIILCLVLFIRWELNRGPLVTISFEDANGITIDSPIMYRGAVVGRVVQISLHENNTEVVIHARLFKTAQELSREGTRWWIVHPSVSLEGVSGLDTIIGPRYIQVLPGEGVEAFTFKGSSTPIPISGKEFTLISDTAADLTIGTPIFYRGIEIGSVVSIGLADNAATARIQINILNKYSQLVRTNSKFWNEGGIDIDAGLTGITLHTGPLTSLIKGGISLATPTDFGEIPPNTFAFTLQDSFEKEWLDWTPEINLTSGVSSK
jgi:paraquat-inducible protein B